MEFLKASINKPVHFISGGLFVSEKIWTHTERIIDSIEIIIGINKTLYIEQDGVQYEVNPGNVLLLLPNQTHRGYKQCEDGVSFYWFHFHCQEEYAMLNESVMTDELSHIDTCSLWHHSIAHVYLPLFSEPLTIDRLNILSQQLLHIAYSNYYTYHSTNYLLTSLLIELSEQNISCLKAKQQRSLTDQSLERIKEWIRINNYIPLSAATVASKFNYNKSYLSRFFKQKTGMSVMEYIHHTKLWKAKELLSNTSYTVKEIAYRIGIEDEKYFMRLFRKYENMTPSEFRQAYYRTHMNNQ